MRTLAILLIGAALSGCLPTDGTSKNGVTDAVLYGDAAVAARPKNVVVTWTANRELGVNASGGGYKVYYSQTSGFSTASASYVSAPWASGTSSPTTATIPNLTPGMWYVKVLAYSALNTTGAISAQLTVTVP